MSKPMYGRVQVPDRPADLVKHLYLHDETTVLKTVDHETPLGVLDQSDLLQQGIHCTKFIPGCKQDPDALGSCTSNTVVEAAAQGMPETKFLAALKKLINSSYAHAPTSYTDVAGAERGAIAFYHVCTDQTGSPAEEWPPEDCGSSGPYMYSELKRLGLVTGQSIAHGITNICSLLQKGPVAMGSPFFYMWEEPDGSGFIDGKGSRSDMQRAIDSGVAGGHETLITAIEKLVLLPSGLVDPAQTVFRVRNHWTRPWGDQGCFRVHGSTLEYIGGQSDFRRFTWAA